MILYEIFTIDVTMQSSFLQRQQKWHKKYTQYDKFKV